MTQTEKCEENTLYIKIAPTSPLLPLMNVDALTPEQETELLEKCPIIHLSGSTTRQQISHFLVDLFAYYFEVPKEKFNEQSCLVDHIERLAWAKELGVSFEDVTYGRILCSQDDDGNVTGGLEDRGMLLGMMFALGEFSKLIGINLVDSAADATFIAGENEFGSYYDCHTIDGLTDLIYSVCQRLKMCN
ncbi:hypothetical protein [Vibrio rarus]|uniref:hypothetical protein n=1 Tax=Vibrio rarus TaxID=413403 RepID=UPI0021C3A0F8|nr:hypothetical protein [Vibrio rarus]